MIGKKIGRWTVTAAAAAYIQPSNGKARKRWLCLCECGNERVVHEQSLTGGGSQSCGCLSKEMTAARRRKHGHTTGRKPSPTYRSWSEMLARCDNPNSGIYEYYGGRGIKVCDRWRSFENFLSDMGERPARRGLRYSIERIDNDGNYEPGNCRWATRKEQARNRRSTRVVIVNGSQMSLAEAAENARVPYYLAHQRLAAGWTVERALEPVG